VRAERRKRGMEEGGEESRRVERRREGGGKGRLYDGHVLPNREFLTQE